MIDITKQYRTDDGREVRLLMTDGGGDYPVLGARYSAEQHQWISDSWTKGGRSVAGQKTATDLIEVKPKHVRWVNVYSECMPGYDTRQMADLATSSVRDRIACIRIEFEEGEGLS